MGTLAGTTRTRTWAMKCKWRICMNCAECLEPCENQDGTKRNSNSCLCMRDDPHAETSPNPPDPGEDTSEYPAMLALQERICEAGDYCSNSFNDNSNGYCFVGSPPNPTYEIFGSDEVYRTGLENYVSDKIYSDKALQN